MTHSALHAGTGHPQYLELCSNASMSGVGRITTALQAVADMQAAAQQGELKDFNFGHVRCDTPKQDFWPQLLQVQSC